MLLSSSRTVGITGLAGPYHGGYDVQKGQDLSGHVHLERVSNFDKHISGNSHASRWEATIVTETQLATSTIWNTLNGHDLEPPLKRVQNIPYFSISSMLQS